MNELRLSNRLAAVAALVGTAGGVIDVGTDHGFLPVWLVQNNVTGRIAATDIKRGPLLRAKATAAEYSVSDRIDFYLTDGLTGIESEGLDTVVLAGMGGETMISVLENAAWTREGRVRCVLQPQSKTELLASWLGQNGYRITDAVLAEDSGRLYLALVAEGGENSGFLAPLDILMQKRDPLLKRYLDEQIGKTRRALTGLERSNEVRNEEIGQKRAALTEYFRMKEETDKWPR